MKNKKIRLEAIEAIIRVSTFRNQDDLLLALNEKGFSLTQATLSRDLKQLKVAKQPTANGDYAYIFPADTQEKNKSIARDVSHSFAANGFLSLDFSGNMAVIKTRPGYAGGIASDIDTLPISPFLGSLAGDDTIFLLLKEQATKETVLETLTPIIPGIRK